MIYIIIVVGYLLSVLLVAGMIERNHSGFYVRFFVMTNSTDDYNYFKWVTAILWPISFPIQFVFFILYAFYCLISGKKTLYR